MKHIDYPFVFPINQNPNIASSFVKNKKGCLILGSLYF